MDDNCDNWSLVSDPSSLNEDDYEIVSQDSGDEFVPASPSAKAVSSEEAGKSNPRNLDLGFLNSSKVEAVASAKLRVAARSEEVEKVRELPLARKFESSTVKSQQCAAVCGNTAKSRNTPNSFERQNLAALGSLSRTQRRQTSEWMQFYGADYAKSQEEDSCQAESSSAHWRNNFETSKQSASTPRPQIQNNFKNIFQAEQLQDPPEQEKETQHILWNFKTRLEKFEKIRKSHLHRGTTLEAPVAHSFGTETRGLKFVSFPMMDMTKLKTEKSRNYGEFTLEDQPAVWADLVSQYKNPDDRYQAIRRSVDNIQLRHGTLGMFRTYLWSILRVRPSKDDIWAVVVKRVRENIQDVDYLVKVTNVKSCSHELLRIVSSGRNLVVDGSFFFIVRKDGYSFQEHRHGLDLEKAIEPSMYCY